MTEKRVGEGTVELIAGGGKIYTDIAARFCRSEKPLLEIIESPYSPKIVRNILDAGHLAALEFDYFIFGVEGYSRVTETQLVRKRLASYLIKSGRAELNGRREFSVVLPEEISKATAKVIVPRAASDGSWRPMVVQLDGKDICDIIEQWYTKCLEQGFAEEDLRYIKPQATEFKAIIGMNAHALVDWFKIRCCQNAQTEIRDLANKMLKLCKKAAPDLFVNAGPSCVNLGYCPENDRQNEKCKGKVYTKTEMLEILKEHRNGNK